jgi:hypothetical protein
MQPRLGGPEWDAKRRRNVGEFEIQAEAQHQQRSIRWPQATDQSLDLIP